MVNILVVDDDKDLLKMVQSLLESAGYAAVTSVDAHDALEKLRQESFDLILSDANMPNVSGFDLIKTIRAQPRGGDIPVALLTGRRDKKDVEYGLLCGADDYFVKPIDPDLFLSKVQNLLNQKPINRPEITFMESAVQMNADWKVTSKITHLSEQGLAIQSPISVDPNTKFKIASPLFDLIGIQTPTLRVLQCTPSITHGSLFTTRVSFVGLTEGELQKIRFWINTNISTYKTGKGKVA